MGTKKHRKSTSYTKRLMTLMIGVSLALTIVTAGMAVWVPEFSQLSVLETLTATWFGGTTIFAGFYCWKSKNENRYKYGQMWVKSIADQYGIENAARFFETTVKGD